jgi:hypothetical protein
MTVISLHMQWPLTSQLHGSFSQREQLVFVTDQTPRPSLFMDKALSQSYDFQIYNYNASVVVG